MIQILEISHKTLKQNHLIRPIQFQLRANLFELIQPLFLKHKSMIFHQVFDFDNFY